MSDAILITGCAGFIGSSLIDKLLDQQVQVIGIDNFDPFYSKASKESNIKNALLNKNFTFLEGDICEQNFISNVFNNYKFGSIIHLAAKAGVRPSIKNPSAYFDVNVNGTLNLLQASAEKNITKFIFASSSSVYGNNIKIPYNESDNVDFPISPYAGSKKSGELLTHIFHDLYNIDVINLRFFTVYGPRQRPDLAIYKFFKSIYNNTPIEMYGDGSTSRDYTFVDDTVAGIIAALYFLKNSSGVYETINLGNSSPVKLSELINLIEKVTQKKFHINPMPMQPGDVVTTYADTSKAEQLLGYAPSTEIEHGLEKFKLWFDFQKTG